MHLSTKQLQQLDHQIDHSSDFSKVPFSSVEHLLSKKEYSHVVYCEQCQNKLNQIKAFRQKLLNSNSVEMPSFDFKKVLLASGNKTELSAKHKFDSVENLPLNKIENGVELQKTKTKKTSVYVTVAMAACLVLFMFVAHIFTNNTSIKEQQLIALIEQNRQIQQEFTQKYLLANSNTLLLPVEIKLQNIDAQIQRSYIGNVSIEEKIALWEQRRQLLIESLKDKEPNTRFYI